VRALSLSEIRDSLHDRFRLLTGGARTAVRRQQTLRASVDWSQALLTESERIMFRRLAVFPSGFDLHAAQAVAGEGELQPHQILDLLTLLVDKSLVVAENASGRRRYRLTETVRQYALEKLGEAGEADKVRDRHRDHYTAMVAVLDDPFTKQSLRVVEQAETEFDNLRAAFGWSRERNAIEEALRIASSLQPLWLSRGRILEGLSWFYAIPADETRPTFDVTPAVHARALADKAMLASVICAPDSLERVERALAIAREIGEAGLLLRALTACGSTAVFIPDVARPYLAEALELARALGDTWRMSQVLWWQAFTATVAGEPAAALEAGFEGSRLVADIGDPFVARMCRFWGIGTAQLMRGEFTAAAAQFRELLAEAEAAHDPFGQLAAQSHWATRWPTWATSMARAQPPRPPPSWAQNSVASWRALATPRWLALRLQQAMSRWQRKPVKWLARRWARIPYPVRT
jgi:hypothetical protein